MEQVDAALQALSVGLQGTSHEAALRDLAQSVSQLRLEKNGESPP